MRKRRIDAKTRAIAKAFLAGTENAIETCWLLSSQILSDVELLSYEDAKFIKAIVSETNDLPVGKLRENWHPDFLPAKLEALAKYELDASAETKRVCERILEVMELRRMMKKQ